LLLATEFYFFGSNGYFEAAMKTKERDVVKHRVLSFCSCLEAAMKTKERDVVKHRVLSFC